MLMPPVRPRYCSYARSWCWEHLNQRTSKRERQGGIRQGIRWARVVSIYPGCGFTLHNGKDTVDSSSVTTWDSDRSGKGRREMIKTKYKTWKAAWDGPTAQLALASGEAGTGGQAASGEAPLPRGQSWRWVWRVADTRLTCWWVCSSRRQLEFLGHPYLQTFPSLQGLCAPPGIE